jgi:hypothetical protein
MMTQKQHAMALEKPWQHGGTLRAQLHEIISNLKNALQIPTGYQDETGFHYGPEPVLQEIQWPPA